MKHVIKALCNENLIKAMLSSKRPAATELDVDQLMADWDDMKAVIDLQEKIAQHSPANGDDIKLSMSLIQSLVDKTTSGLVKPDQLLSSIKWFLSDAGMARHLYSGIVNESSTWRNPALLVLMSFFRHVSHANTMETAMMIATSYLDCLPVEVVPFDMDTDAEIGELIDATEDVANAYAIDAEVAELNAVE